MQTSQWGWAAQAVLWVGAMGAAVAPSCAQSGTSTWGAYVTADTEAWSNGVPVLDLDGTWSKGYRQRAGTQAAYVTARAEVGAALPWLRPADGSAWRVGAVARVDGTARLSGQAAQALYHYQSRTDPDAPVTLDAHSDVLYWTGKGVTVHTPSVSVSGFKLDMTFDHLKLNRLRHLRSEGFVRYNANDTYSYAGTVRDDSSRTEALFMAPPASDGTGQAVSLALGWTRPLDAPATGGWLASRWMPDRMTLRVDAAWSRLLWTGSNGAAAGLLSDVAELGDARINGQYTRRNVTERIPVSTQLQAEWGGASGRWSVRVKNRVGLWQGWLGWQSAGPLSWSVAAEPFAGALQLGLDWRGLRASVMTDRLDNGAHARGAQLSWIGAF